MTIEEKVRAIADPLIAEDMPPFEIRAVVQRRLGVQIGMGGRGYDEDVPQCPYCGAYGGGGHGGFCPGASD